MFWQQPRLPGAQGRGGAVGTWGGQQRGVDRCADGRGARPGGNQVGRGGGHLGGADAGELPGNKEEPKSPGKVHFARSLPMEKARKPEVLLAYKMNGADLSPAHGYPLRLVVPGWYGMASVKWLRRIVITNRPFRGFFQTMLYS